MGLKERTYPGHPNERLHRGLHGSWEYTQNPNTFTVNFNVNPDKLPRAHTFTQIVNTDVYRHVGNKAECTVFLIYLPYASYIETR